MDPTQAGMLTEAGVAVLRQLMRVRVRNQRIRNTENAADRVDEVVGIAMMLGVDATTIRTWRDEVLTPAVEPAGAGGEVRA